MKSPLTLLLLCLTLGTAIRADDLGSFSSRFDRPESLNGWSRLSVLG
jgi:hypothetical protein